MTNIRLFGLDTHGIVVSVLATLIGALAAAGLIGIPESPVAAHSTGHPCSTTGSTPHCVPSVSLVWSYGDYWNNYDFKSTAIHNDNVDWGVNLVFFENAEIDKVKNLIATYNYTPHNGGPMNIFVREANEYQRLSRMFVLRVWWFMVW